MAVVGDVLPCEREVNNYIVQNMINFVFVIFVLMLESENFLKYSYLRSEC